MSSLPPCSTQLPCPKPCPVRGGRKGGVAISYPSMNPTQPKGDDRSLLSCTVFVGMRLLLKYASGPPPTSARLVSLVVK